MKAVAAIILIVVSIAAAEPPAPYLPSGWQPSGPAFRLPERSQKSQVPPTHYGTPPQEYGPPTQNESTTTETTTTTEMTTEQTTKQIQAENLTAENQKVQTPTVQRSPEIAQSQIYVVLPKAQKLLYAAPVRFASPSLVPKAPAKLVEESNVLPIQAIPAVSKIQISETPVLVEQYPQVLPYQQLQVVPSVQAYASSLSQTSVFTPYSSSFVQIYQ